MPTSNINELLSAALASGQLLVTDGALELKPGASKKLKDYVATGLGADGAGTIADRFRRGDRWRVPLDEIYDIENNTSYAAILRVLARAEIKKAWERAGGPHARVGLPLDASFPIREATPGTWVMDCRGGQIQFLQNDRQTIEVLQRKTTVRLVAIECQVRQESSDEVYGVVSVHGPANQMIQTVRIPGSGTLNMGEPGARLTFPALPIVTDSTLEDLYIRVAWIENDSGNVEDIARKVAEKMQQAAAAAAGALLGAGAESVAASQNETFYEAALWIVGDVLGMGDDAYPVEGRYISAGELLAGSGPPLQAPYKRGDDPRTVEKWTHDIYVQGVDDGGDLGRYRFFFDVTRTDTHDVRVI